jgi:uncharacterized membrane protein
VVWIKSQWENVSRGFWFFPGLVALAGAALAMVLVPIDRAAGTEAFPLAFDGDASAARTILGTVAGSLITVAGLAFSITVVTVQLVSSQLTPRAVRSFLADRPSQLVAGTFVGIFAYCLLVLRVVRNEGVGDDGFVPALAVTGSIVLGLVGLVLLLVFIHRITQVIKVENIAARIASETASTIDRLYPEQYGEGVARDAAPASWDVSGEPAVVRPQRAGHVRAVALEDLADADLPASARVHVRVRPGDLVTCATVLIEVWPRTAVDQATHDRLRGLVSVQSERDVAQDVGFGIRQLADVAVRALSPGVNDPTTAVTCIGYLRNALEDLGKRRLPDRLRRMGEDGLLVYAEAREFDELLREAFAEIGRFGRADARVTVAVLDALAGVAVAARRAGALDRAAAARELAEEIAGPAIEDARTEHERRLLAGCVERVQAASG